jgi:hypothetical protein
MDYSDYPYRECIKCENIGNCPHPDIAQDGMGTPVAPEDCPKKEKINGTTSRDFN